MAKLFIEDTSLTNIAKAIRSKANTTAKMTPAQMATAINQIPTGGGEVDWDAPTAPDGGWTYDTSPYKAMWNGCKAQDDKGICWYFDTSKCKTLTITVKTVPYKSSSTYNAEFKYRGYYGYKTNLNSMGSGSSSMYPEWNKVEADTSTKYDSSMIAGVSRSYSVQTVTLTFDVSNYNHFTLHWYALGSSSASYYVYTALYVSDIKYQ